MNIVSASNRPTNSEVTPATLLKMAKGPLARRALSTNGGGAVLAAGGIAYGASKIGSTIYNALTNPNNQNNLPKADINTFNSFGGN